ncbi:transposon ty3-I gag-pol polyprotein [Tanacetum coccineum]|uniref:Transposon ty3-I gag-pol polyprotein n=1 Tax=Tanacetum coccineum TaxID=301880 RepID=A0ABQ5HVZ7_9ASTR
MRFKERNNSLSELRFEVQELLKVINNTLMADCKVKRVTTRGGKTATQDAQNNNANIHAEEPLAINHDEPIESNEVLTNDQPQKTNDLGIIENVLIKVDKFVLPMDFVILDMPEDSRVPIILGRPFLAIARAMIDVFNKKITPRVGDDEVIFDVDQSIKRPPTEDDECYGIDDLGNTINAEAQELFNSFLLRGLEKSIDQSDLESCETFKSKADDDSDSGEPIRRIDSINAPYPVAHETKKPDVKTKESFKLRLYRSYI